MEESQAKERRLRVGIRLRSDQQPAWICELISEVSSLETAEIVLLLKAPPGPTPQELSGSSYVLYNLYVRWDSRLLKRFEDPFAQCDIAPLVRDIPIIEEINDPACHEMIRRQNLDVILDLSGLPAPTEIVNAVRFGIWNYQFGDQESADTPQPGLWDVLDHKGVIEITLRTLTGDSDSTGVIGRCVASTHGESAIASRGNYYWKASRMAVNSLNKLRAGTLSVLPESDNSCRAKPVHPSNARILLPLLRLAARAVKARINYRLFQDQWFFGFRFLEEDDNPLDVSRRFFCAYPPKDRFWADPFPVYWEGRHFVFFEDSGQHPRKGRIAVMEIRRDGTYTEPLTVIEQDYHMSYPCVFRYQDTFYMVPETYASATIDLYRCVEFPNAWEHHATLMRNVEAVDSTMFEVGGRWWMFTMIGGNRDLPDTDLSLYYADSPMGPWLPHRQNPVVSDIRFARPAGAPIVWHGELLRPAQDCSGGDYGRAMSIRRVLELSVDHYEEAEYARIEPAWTNGLFGTHTLNAAKGLMAIDGRRKVRRGRDRR